MGRAFPKEGEKVHVQQARVCFAASPWLYVSLKEGERDFWVHARVLVRAHGAELHPGAGPGGSDGVQRSGVHARLCVCVLAQGSCGTRHRKIISRSARAEVVFFMNPSVCPSRLDTSARADGLRHQTLPWSKLGRAAGGPHHVRACASASVCVCTAQGARVAMQMCREGWCRGTSVVCCVHKCVHLSKYMSVQSPQGISLPVLFQPSCSVLLRSSTHVQPPPPVSPGLSFATFVDAR